MQNEITGIHQGDVVVRTGILAAIEDLRANDWLLEDVFASLPNDLLTKAEYGEREIERAKKWFRSTKIAVLMSHEITDPKLPCISINIGEASEAETTLGDTHYVPVQPFARIWPALTPTFQASYGPITGQVIVPDEIAETLVIAPGMQLIDRAGTAHEILEVIDDKTFMIEPKTADFSKAVIKGKQPSGSQTLGSVKHRESFILGCHVAGEPTHLIYLHSILLFCLYRYKKTLFEARGFERHTVTPTEFRRNEAFENEIVFSRHVNLTGYVAQVWPEEEKQNLTNLDVVTIVDGAGQQEDPEDQTWVGNEDALLLGFKT